MTAFHGKTIGWIALGCLAMTLAGCCGERVRRGILLRHNWSLELNRVPWINSRTICDDEQGHGAECGACGQSACGVPGGAPCGEQHAPRAAQPAPEPVAAPQPDASSARNAPRSYVAAEGEMVDPFKPRAGRLGECRSCGLPRRPAPVAAAVVPARAELPPGSQEHSRFHPMPTQPVFTPRESPVPVAPGAAGGPRVRAQDRPLDAAAPQIQIAPPPEPEEAGTPKAEAKEDRVTEVPRRLGMTVQGSRPSWIFAAPAPGEKGSLSEVPMPQEPPVQKAARPNLQTQR